MEAKRIGGGAHKGPKAKRPRNIQPPRDTSAAVEAGLKRAANIQHQHTTESYVHDENAVVQKVPSMRERMGGMASRLNPVNKVNFHPIERLRKIEIGSKLGFVALDEYEKAERKERVVKGALVAGGVALFGAIVGGVLYVGEHVSLRNADDEAYTPPPNVRLAVTPKYNTLRKEIEHYGEQHGWTRHQEHETSEDLADGYSTTGTMKSKLPSTDGTPAKAFEYRGAISFDTDKLVPGTEVVVSKFTFEEAAPEPHYLDHPGP